jgi:hypothetical protein
MSARLDVGTSGVQRIRGELAAWNLATTAALVAPRRPAWRLWRPAERALTWGRELAPIIAELQTSGVTSAYGITKALNARLIPTVTGRGLWQVTHIKQVLARLGLLRTLKTGTRRDTLRAALVEAAHLTGREAAMALNARGITTLNGALWNSATVLAWRIRLAIKNTKRAAASTVAK